MTERIVTHATFCIERRYDAAPARVFAAWSDEKARLRWFVGGEGWAVSQYRHDFRIGGRESSRFRAEGMDGVFGNETWYQDIVPGERVIFAYSMLRDGVVFSVSLATVEFRADGTGTRLAFTEQGAFLDGADGPDMRQAGWSELLGKLQTELELAA